MFLFSRFDRHARLMARMADALDQDPEAAMLAGRLRPEDYRATLLRCVGCRDAARCERLLDDCAGHLEAAPDFCRNKSEFDAGAL